MKKVLIIGLLVMVFAANGCGTKPEKNPQASIECKIMPIDGFTGEIGFYVMEQRKCTFMAFLTPSATSNDIKSKFDAKCSIPKIEDYVSSQLADYDTQTKITCVDARADNGFRLTCDKPFLGKVAGADLSDIFYVYPLAELKYSDFLLTGKCYNPVKGVTLYDYLSNGSVWSQREYSNTLRGLYFAPAVAPDVSEAFSEDENYTFTLYIPLIGRDSDGNEIYKKFEGSFTLNPTLPGEQGEAFL